MQFEPKTAEQVARLLPDGEYDFLVIAAVEKSSSKGNAMIQVDMEVYGDITVTVRDYLISSESGAWKLRSFAEATGLLERYEAGELTDAECRDKAGRCKIKTDPGDGDFPPKNVVKGYVKAKKQEAPKKELAGVSRSQQQAAKQAAPSDDIPFLWLGLTFLMGLGQWIA